MTDKLLITNPEILRWHEERGLVRSDVRSASRIVPKELSLNLQYRKQVLEMAYSDPEYAQELMILWSRDILFFINTFCWLLEARKPGDWQLDYRYGVSNELPFITRPYQDKAILRTLQFLGTRDIAVQKSRETGVTWIYIVIAIWDWLFHPDTNIGFASKDENSVDDSTDPDSLFSKVDYLVERLPAWMRGQKNRDFTRNLTKHTIVNHKNGSSIAGYASTADIGRGGRKSWFFFDEFHFFPAGADFASLESSFGVTNCRIFVSTINRRRGEAGSFIDLIRGDDRNIVIIDIDWKDDEEKRVGLYKSNRIGYTQSFTLELLDKRFWEPFKRDDGKYASPIHKDQAYEFVLDGRTRSLYYDYQCARGGATMQSISAELDKDPTGATSQVCDPEVIKAAKERVKPVIHKFEVYRDPDDEKKWMLDRQIEGNLNLYFEMTGGRPPESQYSLGFDIAAGTAGARSSYSAMCAIDKVTGQQVADWRSNSIEPAEFAELAIWFCEWFWMGLLIPESNGPLGQMFVNRVLREGYKYLFRQRSMEFEEDNSAWSGTTKPGYRNNDGGLSLLRDLTSAIRLRQCHIHSPLILKEMGRYFFKNEKVVHSSEQSETDGSSVGKAHGDLAIAGCTAYHGMSRWPAFEEEKDEDDGIPLDSFLARREEQQEEDRQLALTDYWSPFG